MTETPAEQPADPFPSEEPGEDYAGDTAEEVVRPKDNKPPADPEDSEG